MTLEARQLSELCDLAIDAAVSTGRYIATTRPSSVEHKDNGGSLAAQVVTEVDRESEARILQTLAPSFDAFNLALLTEETPDDGSRLAKDYFWCIDPIDGTLCFIEGVPGYAVSIALVSKQGVPHIGVVYDPAGDVLYHAIRGGGAFRNRQAWQPAPRNAGAPPRIFTDHGELKQPSFETIAQSLNATTGPVAGAVMNAMRCLDHAPALYFKQARAAPMRGGCFWDFAATACIYREMNAWVSDALGRPLHLNRAESIYLGQYGVLYATHEAHARSCLDALAEVSQS